MKAARDHIPLKVQLAAALLQIPGDDGAPPIPHEHAKLMTADQVISLYHRDHYPIRKIDGGPDAHWNLVFRFIGPHRIKTAKIDAPEIAKGRSIRENLADFSARMAAKAGQGEKPPERKSRWPQGRKLRSRNDLRRRRP